jgi:hypothetical protein
LTNSSGFVSVQFPVPGSPGNYYFTSTATNDSTGNTSIFSNDVDITTGINNLLPGYFQIFPNPASGKFTIQSPTEKISQISITTLSGQAILKKEFLGSPLGDRGDNYEINLTSQPKGIYLVQVVTDKKVYNQKMIVE